MSVTPENLPKALGQWQLVKIAAPWFGRDGAGLLSVGGGLYLIGGWSPTHLPAPYTHSQVWRSLDDGVTWTQLPDAPWEGRHSAGWLEMDGHIFVVGGDMNKGHYQYDVWRGTPTSTGITWVRMSANAAPFSMGRVLHQAFAHNGKLWIVGGQTLDEFITDGTPSTKPGSPFYDDVWSSADHGATWVQESTGGAWAPRAAIIGNAVKDGYMWLVSGGTYETEGVIRTYFPSVWRSRDGKEWELVTNTPGFTPRHYNNIVVLNDELIMLAGWSGENRNDVWASKDGKTWRELRGTPWQIRHAASAVNHKNKVFLMCGPLSDSDVWALN